MMGENARLVSLFDVLGPVMTGPSSSHTAGVLRIGRMGRSLLGGAPDTIELHFYGNALARTYKGHLSDSAIVAGLLGHKENSPGIRDALEEASRRGIPVSYAVDYDSSRDPNTVDMRLSKNGRILNVVGITVGGGEILMTELDGFSITLRGSEDGILFIADESFDPERLFSLLDVSAKIQKSSRGKKTLYTCLLDGSPSGKVVESLHQEPGVHETFVLSPVLDYKLRDATPLFSSVRTMLEYAEKSACSLPEAAVAYECRRSGLSEAEVRSRIMEIWHTMKDSVAKGLRGEGRMVAGLVPGNCGAKMFAAVETGRTVGGPVLGKAVARALAAMETNACAGCVAAAPTAGSCGVVPGVLMTVAEERGASDEHAADALLVAAIIGVLVAMRASLSGSIGGCQAEIGVASAMAASALVHLSGGPSPQSAQAMALALKNILGLICDPVAGPVEIPCIKRNGIGVGNALAAADMALSGLESAIPPDEVIGALVNTQNLLPSELRGTMKGGLGSTPTALRLKEEWDGKISAMLSKKNAV